MNTVSSSGNSFLDSLGGSTAAAGSAASNAAAAQEASDRFLKLLVTQLQNQDPMNPVDNAQMTSQMAQISTVSGIEKLNTTVEGLNGQFVQMQALQGAGLVGKDVLVPGDKLAWIDDVPVGTFEVDSAVSRVKVEVLSPAGRLVDTLNLGALASGRHDLSWAAGAGVADAANHRIRVTAYSGNTPIPATTLMRDRIDAVNTSGSALTVELVRGGRLPYTEITALD